MVKSFTSCDGVTWYRWGYISRDGLFYATRPWRKSFADAAADGARI